MTRRRTFFVVFAAVVLVIAGGVSYFASASPDGLDSATRQGCQVVETTDGEQLTGDCIAKHAQEHPMSSSPLADYAIGGREATGGLAGVIGALVTLLMAGSAFWAIARTRR
jgi:cobalt/nickel transport protein